jgi:hypothetical protein
MTTKQENKLSMYETVLELLINNPAIVALVLAFSNAATAFATNVSLLQQQVALQTAIITGVATAKKARKKILIDILLVIVGAIRAYAKATNDDELFAFVNYKKYKLEKMPDTVLVQLANNIKEKVILLLPSLGDYGITPVVMATFDTAISNYSLFVPKTRTARINKKTITKNIRDYITLIDTILKDELDALAIQLKAPHADFYNNYLSARIIIDLGHRYRQLLFSGTVNSGEIVNVLSPSNHKYMPGVTLRIKNTTTGNDFQLFFYFATTSGEGWNGMGVSLGSGQETTINVDAANFRAYFNVHNQSGLAGSYEVEIITA